MNDTIKSILKPFASLRLTVLLLTLAMVVVFAGTWAQIDQGIWQVQRKYFHSFFVVIDFNIFLPREQPNLSNLPGFMAGGIEALLRGLSKLRLPMIGGYTLIGLLLINLLAAHTVRFKVNRKRAGILLIHGGLILLILGEVITSQLAVETQMAIDEGQTVNYASDIRTCELAVIDPSPTDHDNVTVIPASRLALEGPISYPDLPFQINIDQFCANSTILGPFEAKGRENARATAGTGGGLSLVDLAKFSGTDADKIDAPSAFVTISAGGKNLGTYLLSTLPLPSPFPAIDQPQDVKIGDKTYRVQLRFKRHYRDYQVQLLDFKHDRFTGTDTPRNFSSHVRLIDPTNNVDREVTIWMNHPLRYRGETFYQASFKPGDKTTILQVVRNPGWIIPYVSCVMVALGMVIHFGAMLIAFLQKAMSAESPLVIKTSRSSAGATAAPRGNRLWPAIVTACCVLYLLSAVRPPKQIDAFDLSVFGSAPVSYEGRIMPIDSLARNSLRIVSGKDEVFIEDKSKETWFHRMFNLPAGKSYSATWWILSAMSKPEVAADLPIMRIDHPDILNQLNLDEKQKRFSVKQIMEKRDVLEQQARLASAVDPKKRDLYQKKVLELVGHINLFFKLAQTEGLYLAPPLTPGAEWETVGSVVQNAGSDQSKLNPGVRSVFTMLDAYHNNNAPAFNAAGSDYANWLGVRQPVSPGRINFEVVFNQSQPFYAAMILYVLIFLMVCCSWLFWRAGLQRTALWVLAATLIFHTIALIARIYIQGRPPVTNLYSSAIFIAWAAGIFCMVLELIFRNSIGSLMASVIGFLSLIVAHNLAGSGDTMAMMQAVLDTNFWLATHVVVITLGYSTTFVAGFIAIVYIVGSLLGLLDGNAQRIIYKMVYGILCFAMLFSFVGTVLGGIWADQSWGRFWGWDPKENGAVLIVFWNALILHARWGGLAQARGVMALAVFGNAVTSWSWFGTNMLGVGLHSYGFMDSAVFWLSLFVIVQLILVCLSWFVRPYSIAADRTFPTGQIAASA